jgi:hypothetical protein
MSVNYLQFVSWGIYGGTTLRSGSQMAHSWVSWGLLSSFATAVNGWLMRGYWWAWFYGWREP